MSKHHKRAYALYIISFTFALYLLFFWFESINTERLEAIDTWAVENNVLVIHSGESHISANYLPEYTKEPSATEKLIEWRQERRIIIRGD